MQYASNEIEEMSQTDRNVCDSFLSYCNEGRCWQIGFLKREREREREREEDEEETNGENDVQTTDVRLHTS